MASTTLSQKPSLWSRVSQAMVQFVAAPASARPLAALRISLSTVLLLQALAIAASLLDLFGAHGIVQWGLSDIMVVPGVPRIRWLAELLAPLGVSEDLCVRGVFILYVTGLSMLVLGWHTRLAAFLAFFSHLLLMMSERSSLYGVDDFAHVALFYFLWLPIGHYWSLDVHAGRVRPDPSFAARLGLRVLQIHLCIVYLSSGIEKASTPPYQWLDGDVIWRTAMLPEYRQFDMSWLAEVPWFAKLAAWGALVVELSYAFLIWPKATRKLMALGTIGLHVGIAVMMGLWSFAAVMISLTGSVWLFSAEPESKKQVA